MSEPILKTENLEKTYGSGELQTAALRGVDLAFTPGEFTAIVGPSGSGKTTLMQLMGGLDQPSGGRVILDGEVVSHMSPKASANLRLWKIGFVFQAYNLIPVLTALENAAFVLELRGEPPKKRNRQGLEALEALGIGRYAGHRPSQLSGGQQQRVAMARALAARPQVVLADEPTANLDSAAAIALIDHMKVLNQKLGLTFIFSTHDERLVSRVGRVIRLEDGRVLA